MSAAPLWPPYRTPHDVVDIEAVTLVERGLPPSIHALLCRAATAWPDKTAITVLPDGAHWHQPTECTFAELLTEVHRIANLLHHLGVRGNSAVALIAPNCLELITATLAAQVAGIATPINAALAADRAGELFARSGARVLIAAAPELDAESWHTARRLAERGAVDVVLLLRPTGAPADTAAPQLDGVDVAYLADRAHRHDGSTFHGSAAGPADIAALFHTGGTTGAPKLAAHSHRNQITDAWMIAANGDLNADSVLFAGLPLFHVNALVVTVVAPLLRGQQVVWAGPLGYRDPDLYANFWTMVAHTRSPR